MAGRKAEHEKFAGAEDTYTIEALMHDGKHFSCDKPFFRNDSGCIRIKYVDKNNELHSAYGDIMGMVNKKYRSPDHGSR